VNGGQLNLCDQKAITQIFSGCVQKGFLKQRKIKKIKLIRKILPVNPATKIHSFVTTQITFVSDFSTSLFKIENICLCSGRAVGKKR
jgi:hypothetical protein